MRASQLLCVCSFLVAAAASDCAAGDQGCQSEKDAQVLLQSSLKVAGAEEVKNHAKSAAAGSRPFGGQDDSGDDYGSSDDGGDDGSSDDGGGGNGGGGSGGGGNGGGGGDGRPSPRCVATDISTIKRCIMNSNSPSCSETKLQQDQCNALGCCPSIEMCLVGKEKCREVCAECMAKLEEECSQGNEGSCSSAIASGGGALLGVNSSEKVGSVEETLSGKRNCR